MKISSIKKYIYSLITIIIIFVIWQLIASIKDNEMIYPSLVVIFKRIFDIFKDYHNILTILLVIPKVLLVIIISFLISIIIGYLYYLIPASFNFIRPILTILKVAPFAAIAVYIIMAVNRNTAPYILTLFVSLPIMMESVISSIDNLGKEIKDDISMLNISVTRKFFSGIFPICLPFIILSFLQSFGLGIKTMIMGEYLCSKTNSIGGILYDHKSATNYDYILAWLIILVILTSIIDLIISYIGKRITNKTIN